MQKPALTLPCRSWSLVKRATKCLAACSKLDQVRLAVSKIGSEMVCRLDPQASLWRPIWKTTVQCHDLRYHVARVELNQRSRIGLRDCKAELLGSRALLKMAAFAACVSPSCCTRQAYAYAQAVNMRGCRARNRSLRDPADVSAPNSDLLSGYTI